MAEMNFKVNPNNYRGAEFNSYKDKLQAFAITNPSRYFKMREHINKKMSQDILTEIYNMIYYLLTTGRNRDNTSHILAGFGDVLVGDKMVDLFIPCYPNQKVTEIAQGAVDTVGDLIDEILEKVLPRNHLAIATSITKAETQGSIMKDKE
jgi:hypothetical protein